MSTLFFVDGESKYHYDMKVKLFDLIKNNEIKIIDNDKIEYDFDMSKDKAFLHMESFIIENPETNRYAPNVFYSNDDPPCRSILHLDSKNNLCCDALGHYGVIENLPCRECLEKNIICEENNSIIGYIPDISYGYNNQHKIWVEINYRHPSTNEKTIFCYLNNITLLEIDTSRIENIDNGIVHAINLTSDNTYKYEIDAIIDNMKFLILKNNFADYNYIMGRFLQIPYYKKYPNEVIKILTDNNLVVYKFYDKFDKSIKKFISSKLIEPEPIIITKDFYDILYKNFNYDYDETIQFLETSIAINMKKEIKEKGYALYGDYVEQYETWLINKSEAIKRVHRIIDDNNLFATREYDRNKMKFKGRPLLILNKN